MYDIDLFENSAEVVAIAACPGSARDLLPRCGHLGGMALGRRAIPEIRSGQRRGAGIPNERWLDLSTEADRDTVEPMHEAP